MVELPAGVAEAWSARLEGARAEPAARELIAWFEAHPEALAQARREAALDLALAYTIGPADLRLVQAVTARLGGAARESAEPFAARVMTRVRRRRPRRTAPWPSVAAVLAVAALVAVVVLLNNHEQPPPPAPAAAAAPREAISAPPVAGPLVTAQRGSVELGTEVLELGHAIPLPETSRIAVSSGGAATIIAADGSQLALEGDALLERTGGPWRLAHGALVVDAAPQPPGQRLQIETPQSLVSVIGTRFRVEADAASTWVGVERGHVAMSQGAVRREIAPGQEAEADGDGVSSPSPASDRHVLAPADGAIATIFDAVTFTPIGGTFHALPLVRFDYQPSARARAGFADVGWTVVPRPQERHVLAWFRADTVAPKPGQEATILALMAALDGCDYVLAERPIRPDEHGWVRIAADLDRGRLNWTRVEPAPPLSRAAIRSLSVRAYQGYLTGTLAGPVLLP